MNCKLDSLARECNDVIHELDELASGAAYAEESQRVEALQWIQEQRAYYNELYGEKQKLREESRKLKQ
ncbi:hypothetical protein AGDE_05949 [Angomonas deanei]|nr:hypothetical protein AGDE_05949 [Angomonas deanei]|eukprot:EPY37984.1 hypothetical protein AGDE_05949 [Angomonas deanei]